MNLKSLFKLLPVLACSGFLGTSHGRTTLLGLIRSPIPTLDTFGEAAYVNTLITMANGGIVVDPYISAGVLFDKYNYNNPTPILPIASPFGADDHSWNANVIFQLGSGYNFVTATYGLPNSESIIKVAYYSDNGAFSIPNYLAGTEIIERYTAFRTTDTDADFRPVETQAVRAVPDGGSTFALFGLGLLGLGALRRNKKS